MSGFNREVVDQGFMHLANMLCTAARVEPSDLSSVRLVLTHARGLASLGLEHLAGGECQLGGEIIQKEHPQVLFRTGLALVYNLQKKTMTALESLLLPGFERLDRALRAGQRGVLLQLLDTQLLPVLGFERTEILKGAFNRFPMRPAVRLRPEGVGTEVVFSPLNSLTSLHELAESLDQIRIVLTLARRAAGEGDPIADVDRTLATALLRLCIGGPFSSQPLGWTDARRFVDLSETDFLTRIAHAKDVIRTYVSEPASQVLAVRELALIAERLSMGRKAAVGDGLEVLAGHVDFETPASTHH